MKRFCKCGKVADPNSEGRCKTCRKIYLAERKKREKDKTDHANIYRKVRPERDAVLFLQEATQDWGSHDDARED